MCVCKTKSKKKIWKKKIWKKSRSKIEKEETKTTERKWNNERSTHAINVCDGVVEPHHTLHEARVHKFVCVAVDTIEIHSKYIHQNQYMENSNFKVSFSFGKWKWLKSVGSDLRMYYYCYLVFARSCTFCVSPIHNWCACRGTVQSYVLQCSFARTRRRRRLHARTRTNDSCVPPFSDTRWCMDATNRYVPTYVYETNNN